MMERRHLVPRQRHVSGCSDAGLYYAVIFWHYGQPVIPSSLSRSSPRGLPGCSFGTLYTESPFSTTFCFTAMRSPWDARHKSLLPLVTLVHRWPRHTAFLSLCFFWSFWFCCFVCCLWGW